MKTTRENAHYRETPETRVSRDTPERKVSRVSWAAIFGGTLIMLGARS